MHLILHSIKVLLNLRDKGLSNQLLNYRDTKCSDCRAGTSYGCCLDREDGSNGIVQLCKPVS